MILNVSGRTDIVAFYSEWFMDRYDKGFVDVRNPFYPKNVSRIYFKDVDLIVFCTKNPIPMFKYIDKIDKPFIFHVTLTPYKKDIEPNVAPKGKIIEAIKELSRKIGSDNLYIRYDPVFLNDVYTLKYHIKYFDRMCMLLDGYVNKIIISFIDDYKNVRKNMNILRIKPFTDKDYKQIGINFANSARCHNMTVQTCAERENLVEYGFVKQDCITKDVVKRLTGKEIGKRWTARNNKHCNCVQMVDIGVYNSCMHGCKYCYANYDEDSVCNNMRCHDVSSSLLIGSLSDDVIKVRKA